MNSEVAPENQCVVTRKMRHSIVIFLIAHFNVRGA
jgi:hypothetical protein